MCASNQLKKYRNNLVEEKQCDKAKNNNDIAKLSNQFGLLSDRLQETERRHVPG